MDEVLQNTEGYFISTLWIPMCCLIPQVHAVDYIMPFKIGKCVWQQWRVIFTFTCQTTLKEVNY